MSSNNRPLGSFSFRSLLFASLLGLTFGYLLGSHRIDDSAVLPGGVAGPREPGMPSARIWSGSGPRPSAGSAPSAEDSASWNARMAEWGCNEYDLAESSAIGKRSRADGEYFLPSDDPIARKAHRSLTHRIASKAVAESKAQYQDILQRAGVPPDKAEFILGHLTKTRMASLELSGSMLEFHSSRQKLDERLRANMSEEGYAEFRRFEENQRGRQDVQSIKYDFEKATGAPLSQASEQKVLDLMRESGAYSQLPREGLYDGYPVVGVGKQMCAEVNQLTLTRLQEGLERLARLLPSSTLTDEEKTVALNYFQARVAQIQADVASLTSPAIPGDQDDHGRESK